MWRWFAIPTLCSAAPCTTKWCFAPPNLHSSQVFPPYGLISVEQARAWGPSPEAIGEQDDVRAALDYLAAHFPGLPVCLMGFSFGSWVGLEVGATDPRVSTLVGLGVPVDSSNFDFLLGLRKPKLILQGTRDEFGPAVGIAELYDSLAEPKQIHWVQGADHFFAGKLDEVQEVLSRFLYNMGIPIQTFAPGMPEEK